MEVNVENLGPCLAKVSFTVPSAEFDQESEKALRHVASHMKLKGFRPGKVPTALVKRQHGAQVRAETVERFVQQAYRQAIEENELRPAAHPRVELAEDPVEAGADFKHSFELSLKPKVELGEYKGLKVEGRGLEVGEEELAATLEDVRRQQARPEPAGEDGLPEDGMAIARLQLQHGEELALEREGLRLSPTHGPAGIDQEAYKSALVGAREGTEFELPFTFPEEFEREELRGKEGIARFRLDQVFRIVLPEQEELFRQFEANDEEDLHVKVRERIREAKEQSERNRIESALLEQIIAEHEMDLPAALVEDQVQSRLETQRKQMEQNGMPSEEIEQALEAERETSRDAAEKSLRAYYLIEAISQAESLEVDEKDLIGELKQIAERNQASFEEVRDYYREENLFNQLAMELLERKVRTFLRESAQVKIAG